MNILHLDSSIAAQASASHQLSLQIVDGLTHQHPAAQVRYRDLVAEPVPHLTGAIAAGFRGTTPAGEGDATVASEHARSEALVREFLDSQLIVIGVPMYNFSVPSQLKAWMDRIAQPGRTFRYTAEGPVGLAGGRRVVLASTRGGMYSVGNAAGMDFQEAYLRAYFGFLGITDVHVVRAERLTKGAELREQSLTAAGVAAQAVVAAVLAG